MAGKSLDNLIRLHKWNVDEKRRVLAERLREMDELEKKLQDLATQLANEQQIAASNPAEAGFAYGRFASFAINRREELQEAIRAKETEIQAAQDVVAEAFKELKTYEEAERLRLEKERKERDRKEQAFLDEIGQNIYRRNLNQDKPED